MKIRCPWCEGDELYVRYHDTEWGVPVFDDRKQFEFLVLESAQAGLSWLTILKKREGYRKAFADFDPVRVAAYNRRNIEELMQNSDIIRNRRKISAAISNAERFVNLQEQYGSFCAYFWEFTGGSPIVNSFRELSDVPAKTELSEKISKDLKQRGFTFVGPTIIYSHMQATGMVNDHLTDCFRYRELVEHTS